MKGFGANKSNVALALMDKKIQLTKGNDFTFSEPVINSPLCNQSLTMKIPLARIFCLI